MILHELHKRRLQATVLLVEKCLERIERLVLESGPDGIVKAVVNSLTMEEREAVLRKTEALRVRLRQFADSFHLPRQEMEIRQILNAELSSIWVMLENCRPKRMKGFGQRFDPQAAAALELRVEQLLSEVKALREMIQ